MLYVDGMAGVMRHRESIEWLYTLISSKYRLVVKTSLKLLLVFVEYCESNCYSLINAIRTVDAASGTLPWSNVMRWVVNCFRTVFNDFSLVSVLHPYFAQPKQFSLIVCTFRSRLLKDYENADTELLIYATTLINKTLSGLGDQDAFYDETDFLEHQGMEGIIQRYMSRPGTDLDLLDQLQLYELVMRFEDGEIESLRIPDNTVRTTHRQRSTTGERRKSYRHSADGISLPSPTVRTEPYTPSQEINPFTFNIDNAGLTPGLKRSRERPEAAADDDVFMMAPPPPPPPSSDDDKLVLEQLKRDQNVKDLTQKLSNLPLSPTLDDKPPSFLADGMIGLISKAKEELSKSKSRSDVQSSVDGSIGSNSIGSKKTEQVPVKKSETDMQWEELVNSLDRELKLCDLDFTDLTDADDDKSPAPKLGPNMPPPPPPLAGLPALPKLSSFMMPMVPTAPKMNGTSSIKKNKKTVS